jgi:hypothetical protein
MRIRRRKAFDQLFDLLRRIEQDDEDIPALMQSNGMILAEILRAERAVQRHRDRHRALTRALKTERADKAGARQLRTQIKRTSAAAAAQEDMIYIWKSFGDALAFLYLDRFSIKHAYFEIDKLGVKRDAGMLGGKKGLAAEVNFLAEAAAAKVPAILCDVTNVLRYGDVCLLGASDPVIIEVKSSERLNARAKRQLDKLQRLNEFLETDRAQSLRGFVGPTARVALTRPPRDNVGALNACIGEAKTCGEAVARPEPGITYVASYGRPDVAAIFPAGSNGPRMAFMLNSDKNDRAWAPYTPFLLTIREREHLLDFIEGRLILMVFVDPAPLCEAMANDEWMVRFRNHPDYPIQCVHRPSHAYLAISSQFLFRAAYEFASLSWIAETQRPSLATLEAALGDGRGDAALHQARLRELLGEGDPWLEELGLE